MYSMVQNYHYTVSDLENMIPFERDIFIGMIKNDIESNTENGTGS
jgi:hypothetical protein